VIFPVIVQCEWCVCKERICNNYKKRVLVGNVSHQGMLVNLENVW